MAEIALALFLFALIYGGLLREQRAQLRRREMRQFAKRFTDAHLVPLDILHRFQATAYIMARANLIVSSLTLSRDEKTKAIKQVKADYDRLLEMWAHA